MPAKPSGPPGKKRRKPGPKERELATQLTIAILHAARPHDASIDELSDRVAALYRKMLLLVESEAHPAPSGETPPSRYERGTRAFFGVFSRLGGAEKLAVDAGLTIPV